MGRPAGEQAVGGGGGHVVSDVRSRLQLPALKADDAASFLGGGFTPQQQSNRDNGTAGGTDDDSFAALMGGGARSMRITRDSEEENEKNKRSDAARDDGMETVKRRTRGWRSLDRCSNGFLLVLQLGCLGLNGLDGCPKDSIVVCPRREGGPTREPAVCSRTTGASHRLGHGHGPS